MDFKTKRKKMETLIYDVFTALDPSGANTEKYKKMLSLMTDKQFDDFFKKFFKDENQYFLLDIIDYERELKMEQAEKAAKILDVPLFEKVAIPFANDDKDNPVVTKHAVPVGYLHIKRVQQILSKKNTTSTDISSRSALTGQVVGKDKNARDTDMENFALVTLGAEQSLREFLGPRSDDHVMKMEMYSDIAKNGYVSLDNLTDKVENKTTLNTVDAYFIGMGIKSDLVTPGLVIKKTLNE